ncbi:MAG: hypothetical protein GQ535_08775 [Rhodobacteraceae bacterium]|nr:hypothetical protein [Paracoccaceae bacterium]
MYEILYQGVDSLDVAYKGVMPKSIIEELEEAKNEAGKMQNDKSGYPVTLGPDKLKLFVKATGKKGGYRYVFVDDPTGAIFAVSANTDPNNWNFFVSARARGLLCRGYEGMKAHMLGVLTSLGAQITNSHVSRIDYAIDIAATNFELDMKNFIAPHKAKLQSYYGKDQDLDDDGNRAPPTKENDIRAVMSGGRFESVTVGKMPGRQIIFYDKRKAAKDQKTEYWFDVWKVDPNDKGTQIWRIEIRAGKVGLSNHIGKAHQRTYETVEAILATYLADSLGGIWYATNKGEVSNVSRSTVHPIWDAARRAVKTLPMQSEPPLPRAYMLELMRKEKAAMASAQAFGNLNNALVLAGFSSEEIAATFSAHARIAALRYCGELGKELHLNKLERARKKLEVFIN